jgi:hypothetical protein
MCDGLPIVDALDELLLASSGIQALRRPLR